MDSAHYFHRFIIVGVLLTGTKKKASRFAYMVDHQGFFNLFHGAIGARTALHRRQNVWRPGLPSHLRIMCYDQQKVNTFN